MTNDLFVKKEGFSLPELKQRKVRLTNELEVLDQAINALERLHTFDSFTDLSNEKPMKFDSDLSKHSVYDGAVILLEEKGNPMKTKEIVEGLKARGKQSGAGNPFTSVYSSLNKSLENKGCKIKKLGDGYWGLIGRD
jgi:hypothetical protein